MMSFEILHYGAIQEIYLAVNLDVCLSSSRTMSLLLPIEAFDNFKTVKDFPISGFSTDVLPDLIQRVRELDEREEFEPQLRSILADGASTPHGPAEIVDIFTHHVTANSRHGMAA